MKFGTMVLCVVADRDHAATSYGTCFAELLQKLQKGFAVENARFRAETETGHPANARPRSNPRSCVSGDDTRPGLCFPAESTCGSGNPAAESALRPAPTGPRCRPASVCGVFFMHLLPCRVGARQHGPGLAETEVELSEQALALTYAELDPIGLVDPRRQGLAIP